MTAAANGVSLGRVTTALLIGRALSYGLALINSIIVARALGAARMGEYAYAMGLAGFFGLVPHMGISTIVTRAVALDSTDAKAVLKAALRAQSLLAGGVLIIIPAFAAALPVQPVPLVYIGLAATQLSVGALSWPYLAILGGHARYDKMAISEVIAAAFTTVVLLAVALTRADVPGFLAAQAVAAGGAVLAARWVSRPFLRDCGTRTFSVKGLIQQAAPFGATAAVRGLYTRLDTILLGQMSSTMALGLYNVAYKPTTIAVSLGSTVAGTLFPVLARPPHEAVPPSYTRGARTLGVAAPAMALALCGLAEPLLVLLYGEQFRAAAPILMVLALSAAAHWFYAPLGVALLARGRERIWLRVMIGALVLNAVGNLWAIPRWGALGAAGATLASELAIFLLGLTLVWRLLAFPVPLRSGLVVLAAAGVGWAALNHAEMYGALPATAAGLVAYGAVLVTFRIVRKDDVVIAGGWVRDAVAGGERS